MKKARRKRYDACDELEGIVEIDIFSAPQNTAAQRRHPTASPAQRVVVGKEEQRRERALTFEKKSEQAIQSLLRRGASDLIEFIQKSE